MYNTINYRNVFFEHKGSNMKQNIETMRYKVPKVKNRFVQTHLKLIVICAIVVAVIVMLSLSYVLIRQSYVLEPKTTILLFCQVDNYDETQTQLSKYKDLFNIIFVNYEADYQGEDGSYNLDSFGSIVASKYSTPSANLVAVALPLRGDNQEFTFADIQLAAGATLNADTVDGLIALIRSSL